MKKQILTVMALAIFTITGTAFVQKNVSGLTHNGTRITNMEALTMHPDSVVKSSNTSMMPKEKMKKKAEDGKMHNMQEMKSMSGHKAQQSIMSQMLTIRQHMMQMMDRAKKKSGNDKITKKQKDEMYSMMTQMMPHDKAQKEKMIEMNARMIQIMKSGDISKKNEMMDKMDPEMKAKMMKMMPKTKEEKAKVMKVCTLMQEMMQRMQNEEKEMEKNN